MKKKRILFTGYAHVHFICFLPIYKILQHNPNVEVFLSGGFRIKEGTDISFSQKGFYNPFEVDKSKILSIEEIKNQDFDVLVCSHLSDSLFPRSAKKKVQIFHGVSFKNLSVREKALRFDVLCLPGRYHAELYQEQGLVQVGGPRYLVTGFPKADLLVKNNFNKKEFLAQFGIVNTQPTILFAPTGEKQNALEIMGQEIAHVIGKHGSWNLLIKPHDHPKIKVNWFKKLAIFEDENVKIVRDKDVIPYLLAADILLTDASSVAVEYTLLNRPIVFLEVTNLLKRISKRAPAMDLHTYGRKIGTIAENAKEVVSVIEDSLVNSHREDEIRRKMAEHVFYKPGGAVNRVTNVILHAAGLEQELQSDIQEIKPIG